MYFVLFCFETGELTLQAPSKRGRVGAGSVSDLWALITPAEQSLEVSCKGPASGAPQAPSSSEGDSRLRHEGA